MVPSELILSMNDIYEDDETKNEKIKLCLKHRCREVIRSHLLEVIPHLNLFVRVPALGLPPSLSSYLLHHVTLQTTCLQLKTAIILHSSVQPAMVVKRERSCSQMQELI